MNDQIFYLIKDWGFPMIMCGLLWYQSNVTIKQNTLVLSDIRDFMMYGRVSKRVRV